MVGLVGFGRRGLKKLLKSKRPTVYDKANIKYFLKKTKENKKKEKERKEPKERKRKKKKRKEKKVFPKKVFNNVCFLKKFASKKHIYLYHYALCMVFLQTNTDLMSVYNTF